MYHIVLSEMWTAFQVEIQIPGIFEPRLVCLWWSCLSIQLKNLCVSGSYIRSITEMTHWVGEQKLKWSDCDWIVLQNILSHLDERICCCITFFCNTLQNITLTITLFSVQLKIFCWILSADVVWTFNILQHVKSTRSQRYNVTPVLQMVICALLAWRCFYYFAVVNFIGHCFLFFLSFGLFPCGTLLFFCFLHFCVVKLLQFKISGFHIQTCICKYFVHIVVRYWFAKFLN